MKDASHFVSASNESSTGATTRFSIKYCDPLEHFGQVPVQFPSHFLFSYMWHHAAWDDYYYCYHDYL